MLWTGLAERCGSTLVWVGLAVLPNNPQRIPPKIQR